MKFDKILQYQKIDQEANALRAEMSKSKEWQKYQDAQNKLEAATSNIGKLTAEANELLKGYESMKSKMDSLRDELAEFDGILEDVQDVNEAEYYLKLVSAISDKLNALEKDRCDSIDRVADCFASLMRDITRELIETDNDIDDFTYNLGRMVYLLDAVDDVEKDSKKKRYNPLLLNYGECASKQEYLAANMDELSFLLNSTYNKMVGCYNRMDIKLYEGVLSNTVYLGIKMQMERLLKGDEKCQLTRL